MRLKYHKNSISDFYLLKKPNLYIVFNFFTKVAIQVYSFKVFVYKILFFLVKLLNISWKKIKQNDITALNTNHCFVSIF